MIIALIKYIREEFNTYCIKRKQFLVDRELWNSIDK